MGGRKSSIVKVITYRDNNLLKGLARIGLINGAQAKEYCSLTAERIKKLENSGFIKTSYHAVRGENNLIIQLDDRGKEFCRQENGIRNFCVAQTNHLYHDLKLAEAYYNLPEEVQNTWRHEGDLIRDIYENFPEVKGKLETCVDATVDFNGETIAIESVGLSYTQKLMDLKLEIATKYLGCSRMESV